MRQQPVRFGDFVLDLSACELRRHGRSVRVERRPMDVLMLLVQRRNELVTREEIVDRLWGPDVFVDVDAGINTVIRKLRRALRDSADRSRYIQTVQGRGYRFIADVAALPVRAVLAVLAFENLQGDHEQDYMADGLTEETIVELARAAPERLSVIGRRTSMAYRRTAKTVGEIGRELNADYIVEGSIRGRGARVRVTATLTRVSDQVQIWTDTYDRDAHSLLGLQAELGRDIAQQIHLRLAPDRAATNARVQTQNARAYDLYLRGRYYYNQMTEATAARALDCFRNATALDPLYALAWAGIADTYSSRLFNSDTPAAAVSDQARAAAMQAMQADDNLAESHTALGRVLFLFDWDWRRAEGHLRRALVLDPASVQTHWMLGHALSMQDQHESAIASAALAIALDPLDALSHTMAAQIAFTAGRLDEAAAHANQARIAEPEFWVAHWQLGQTYEQLGRIDEALDQLDTAARLSNGNSKPLSLSAYVLARAGRLAEARRIAGVLEERSERRYVPPVALALAYAGLNEKEAAVRWLERAVHVRDVHLIYVRGDRKWERIREDRCLQTLLNACGL